jgi:YesN/AraC family two-component response regulator
MVKEYTLLHNGQIDVSADEKTGTTFIIRIPMYMKGDLEKKSLDNLVTPSKISLAEHKPFPDELAHDGKRKLILVIEDNSELRTFLKKSLSGLYTVITAPDGKKGFEQAVDLNPDLIVSDVMMPVMDGFELCQQIKNDINTSHIPVILLTALSNEDSQIEGYRKGADAYIAKPFSERLLQTQIENLLLNRQKLKERFFDPDSSILDGNNGNGDLLLIDKAISIVEEHLLDTNFTVETLAEKMKMSRTSLHRKLKAHTDQSATEFIRFVRLKKALKMLKAGNNSIDEVSYTVGFNSPSYFSQSFKKQFGKSPKEYIQHNDNP